MEATGNPGGAKPGAAKPAGLSLEERLGPASTGPQFFVLSRRTIEELEGALTELWEQSRARCAFILDRTGCILASQGDFYPMNPQTMGAIAAGAIAALNSLVSRAESREVTIRFYGGEIERIHFALISDRLIVTLLHSHNATTGNIRNAVRNFIQRVRPILEREQTRPGPIASVEYIEKKLDEMFREAIK